MAPVARLLAGILLLSLLAGCAHRAAVEGPAVPGAAEPLVAADSASGRVWAAHPEVALAPGQVPLAARFAYTGPLNLTKVTTGTFAPQQVCPASICVLAQQLADLDITASLPKGMPLRVTATLATPAALDAPTLFPMAPEGDRLEDEGSEPADGGARAVFLLQRNVEGLVFLRVLRSDPGDATMAYTLTLAVEVLASAFDARTPLAVQVPQGATAIAVEVAKAGGDVRAWDPKDAYLGNHSLAKGLAVIPVRQAGEHVLQLTGAAAATRIHVLAPEGPAPLLRALAFTRTRGEVRTATGASPVEWTFQADRVPLGVGIAMASSADGSTAIETQASVTYVLKGPDGQALAERTASVCICNLRVEAGAWGSPTPAGTYSASYTSSASAQVQLWHFVDAYQR